ncbi:DedA family protein [Kribbia dieselivorans]|uniref:DedA family protein n=1 Tax=Kribbia dieselivorans TaxID=331526 RepID=UPI0008397DC7|nr:DedA family protein [Kribbia dieselivorans]
MQSIIDWVLRIMDAIGGPGVAVAIALESIFPPIPSEVVLPLAGFTASQGRYTLVEAIVWATLGSVVGAVVLYYVGLLIGLKRIRAIADWMWLVDVEDVDKSVRWFDKNGAIAVFVGRLIPGIRSLISIPAGIDKMPMGKFLLYTGGGSLVWNTILVGLGYQLGSRYHLVEQYMNTISNVVYVVLIVIVLAVVVWMARRAKARGRL